jgi:hypothetical protein
MIRDVIKILYVLLQKADQTIHYILKDDLWTSLTEVARQKHILNENQTLNDFMESWTLQSGYPVINVNRSIEE